ncbi:MAG: hypothetical protein HYY50_02895 [Candidatus Kerfeldbacteria bacterium]|nr:hypothetical protein [Candidatus Kerfeldbacteria bacterium]
MMTAHVVPIRGLPPEHRWFEYSVPTGLTVAPGSLVEIPLRRQLIQGIVWAVSKNKARALRPISRLLAPEVVLTPWQRQLCETISDLAAVSLATVVSMCASTFPSRRPVTRATFTSPIPGAPQPPPLPTESPPTTNTWWYGDRRQAIGWLTGWLAAGPNRVVIVPTIEDGWRLWHEARRHVADLRFISSQLTPRDHHWLADQVRHGRVQHLIGTLRALFLPYQRRPEFIIDQEEHPAHKLRQRLPRLDARPIISRLTTTVIATSPAPTLHWYWRYHPSPPPPRGRRMLVALDRPNAIPWVSQELQSLIDDLKTEQHLLLIVPRRGLARAIICQDCGWAMACPFCQQRLSLNRQSPQLSICQNCGRESQWPAICPRCRGVHWQYAGLALDRFALQLRRQWPQLELSTSWPPLSSARLWLGTYQVYRYLLGSPAPQAIVLVSGDALLNWPDYSAAERGWQYLARLAAAAPRVPLWVQTFAPQEPFWQRWRQSDHRAWYEDEIHQRRKLQLPPWSDQWIAFYRGPDARTQLGRLQQRLRRHSAVSCHPLPLIPGRSGHDPTARLLVSGPRDPGLSALLPRSQFFPYPWQLDTMVDSWLPS